MIITVDRTNLLQATMIHSISWKESHRFVCVPDFARDAHTRKTAEIYAKQDELRKQVLVRWLKIYRLALFQSEKA